MTVTEITTTKPTSILPTEKTAGSGPSIYTSKVLVYGEKKIGKSTLAAELDPDHTIFLSTEPGQDALSIFNVRIKTWEEFLLAGAELSKGEHPYKIIVIDTVDELARLCMEYVIAGMTPPGRKGFVHASDFEWGKGWDAVAQEFRLRVAKLSNLGYGVVFISHVKESPVKTRTGAEITKLGPDVGMKGMRKWLLGFVDVIAYAHVIQTGDGKQHVLQLQPTETVEAGMRAPRGVEVPALIPLSAQDLKAVLKLASKKKEAK